MGDQAKADELENRLVDFSVRVLSTPEALYHIARGWSPEVFRFWRQVSSIPVAIACNQQVWLV